MLFGSSLRHLDCFFLDRIVWVVSEISICHGGHFVFFFCQAQDVVNATAPLTPVLPVPATVTTTSGSGTAGASAVGFKARTGPRSSPKTRYRLQNASKPGPAVAGVADRTVPTKQNQSNEQAEKKNQAINQLKKLLVQGNKKVEALATVIQHLFTEVLVHQTRRKSSHNLWFLLEKWWCPEMLLVITFGKSLKMCVNTVSLVSNVIFKKGLIEIRNLLMWPEEFPLQQILFVKSGFQILLTMRSCYTHWSI